MTESVPQKLVVIGAARSGRRGPKTEAGKARCSLNAVQHGLLAARPVLATEDRVEFDDHVAKTIEALGAHGHVEMLLATRAAQLLWRLARLTRFEAGVIDKAQREGSEAATRLFREASDEVELVKAATALLTEQALQIDTMVDAEPAAVALKSVAGAAGVDPVAAGELLDTESVATATINSMIDGAAGNCRDVIEDAIASLRLRLRVAQATAIAAEEEMRQAERAALLPAAPVVDSMARYEAHLQRALSKTLQEFRGLQERRLPATHKATG